MKYILSSFILSLVVLVACFGTAKVVLAQSDGASQSTLYVPLIGITSVPSPSALPRGPGEVTYNFAVKNFLKEVPLHDVSVVDDHCGKVTYTKGDTNDNSLLDYDETWRYSCTTTVSTTTHSIATAVGSANDLRATHKAYVTVVVGSETPAPLVSIINITKVAYPLSLPVGGGAITFTYKVTNPGVVPLRDVSVVDDKCSSMSNKLGDTNYNNQLDTTEVWIYTCTTLLRETTTNTVHVTAFANGLQAVSDATITVKVDIPSGTSPASAPSGAGSGLKMAIWAGLGVMLVSLSTYYVFIRQSKSLQKKHK